MADARSNPRLVAVLWFVAGALAMTAVALRATRGGHIDWGVGVAGLFCLVMGIAALARRGAGPKDGPPS
jgi:hypothetical protein